MQVTCVQVISPTWAAKHLIPCPSANISWMVANKKEAKTPPNNNKH